jgi:hypothetical protein
MNRAFVTLLIAAFLASGCTATPIGTDTPPVSSILESTPTPVAAQPTNPPLPATEIPSAAAACPDLVENVQAPVFPKSDGVAITFAQNEQTALDFLNRGGKPEDLLQAIADAYGTGTENHLVDMTGDGIAEIVVSAAEIYMFGCSAGNYITLLKVENPEAAPAAERDQIVAVEDMNLNGVPELVIASHGCEDIPPEMCLDVVVLEWYGAGLASLAEFSLHGRQLSGDPPEVKIQNTNEDEYLELTVTGGIPVNEDYARSYPWRQETQTYTWNGVQFQQTISFSAPQFLYQVVQDADQAALHGDYDEALKLYQNAIYGNYDWFSPARKQYFVDQASGESKQKEPELDPNEKVHLTGYSYYRTVLAYVLQENQVEAQSAYERIHKNYAKGFPGYEYLLLTDAFWNEYQASQDMEKACGKAIDFVSDHPDILKYLGSDHHNVIQDTIYKPEDVCPFK